MENFELLQECKLQLEYLNEKFGETGTTNSLLSKLNQALHKPVVSGKRPLDSAKYVCEWYSDWFKRREENKDELFGTDEILNTHSQTFLEFYQAASASGAVDKTVSEGNALQNFLKQEKEIEKRDGKIFDE